MALPINRTLLFFLLSWVLALTSCHVGRYVFWNFADINDYEKFHADTLFSVSPAYHFKYSDQHRKLYLPTSFQTGRESTDLEDYLKSKHTKAFIIIRKDSIIYERYFICLSRNCYR